MDKLCYVKQQTDENNGGGDSGNGAAIVGMKWEKLCE